MKNIKIRLQEAEALIEKQKHTINQLFSRIRTLEQGALALEILGKLVDKLPVSEALTQLFVKPPTAPSEKEKGK